MNTKEIKEQIVEEVIAGLETCGNWQKLWETAKDCYNPISKTHYSFLNCLILKLKRDKDGNIVKDKNGFAILEDANNYITFKQAEQIGAKINKGAKGKKVLFYKTLAIDITTGKTATKDTESQNIRHIPYLTNYTVFSVDDITFKNEQDKQKYTERQKRYEHESIEDIEKVLNEYYKQENIKVTYSEKEDAYYRPSEHSITVPTKERFKDLNEYYTTLFHETVHSTGKTLKRFDEKEKALGNKKEEYSKEELVAELGAMMLCEYFNLKQQTKNSIAYIKGWASFLRDNIEAITYASTKSQKAIELILNK